MATTRSVLAGKEGRQLDDVADISHRLRLVRLVHVGDHRHAEGFLNVLENPHALFQSGATEGVDGGAVGLVETGLEHVGDAELLGHLHIGFADLQRQIAGFQHVHAAEQHERLVVGDLDIADANDLLAHALPAL